MIQYDKDGNAIEVLYKIDDSTHLTENELHDACYKDQFIDSLNDDQRKHYFSYLKMQKEAAIAYKLSMSKQKTKKSIYQKSMIKWTPDKYRDVLRMWRGNQMFSKKKDIIATISIKYGVGSKRIYQVIRKAERLEKEGKL